MASTSDWATWRTGVFGGPYLVWHDGPDFHYLLMVAEDEIDEVTEMLAAGVEAKDPLAPLSLAALAEAGMAIDGAEALLREALPDASGTFLVRLAQALRTVTGDQSWSGRIAGVLTSVEADWYPRLDAAIALADFTATPELVRALGQAVCDEEYLVRYHAANTLLRYAGRASGIADDPELFGLITSGSSIAAWQEAAERLTGAVRL